MIKRFFLLIILPTFLYSSQGSILKLAQKVKLYNKTEWKALTHYDNGFKVIDSNFLLSQNHLLKNELEATINSFYDLPSKYSDTNLHPQCKFPARLLFISHELNISKDEFPDVSCENLQVYEQKAPADEISLIYASENVKNPSSMMGHTFLKFSGKNFKGREVEHAITFYTLIENMNPLTLIYQNTISGMKGMFALQPYKKIKENYSKKENRNVWEYKLSLSNYRKKLIYYHAWELKGIEMKYFFTSYNCATVIYNMISLANPKIYNQKKLWITPLDTVKFLYKYNLIKNTQLFPSNTWLVKMLEDTKNEVNTTKNLDKIIFDISKYKSPSKTPNERQLQLGYTKRNDEDCLKLSFLPASHNLNDYNREYFGESELKIAYLSFLVNNENIELDEFTLYGMKSYMPYSSLTHDLSYQFELAVKKEYTENMEYSDTLKIDGGVGLDFLFFNDINVFAILNGGLGYNHKDNTHLFFNPQVGIMIYELLNMKSLFYYEPYFINDSHTHDKYVLNHNVFTHENYTFYLNFEKIQGAIDFTKYEFGLKYLF